MHPQSATPERMGAFSDGVMAVVITLMVLELKPPAEASLRALIPLWPTAASYGISYAFIAVIWVNHHHLLRFVKRAEPPLLWLNFVHLFLVSVLPFATAWMAKTGLGPAPTALYAALFVTVNLAYAAFQRAVFRQAEPADIPPCAQRAAWRRVQTTVAMFAAAGVVALAAPLLGVALICAALGTYLRPDTDGRRASSRPTPARPVHALARVEA